MSPPSPSHDGKGQRPRLGSASLRRGADAVMTSLPQAVLLVVRLPVAGNHGTLSGSRPGLLLAPWRLAERLFDRCSHFCELVSQPARMPPLARVAIGSALGRGGVGPRSQVELGSSDLPVRDEVGSLVALAQEGPERRGLMRLQALAALGGRIPGSVLHSLGE